VKIQIERKKFKLVITDVLTEGVQGSAWQSERACAGSREVMPKGGFSMFPAQKKYNL
jgi:hypothetical protein